MKSISIIGNVGTPAVMRVSADGKQLISFSVATTNRDKSTTWFSIIGRGSEQLAAYIVKGRQIFVQGDLEVSLYKGNIDLSVFADRIELCGKSTDDNAGKLAPTPQDNAANAKEQNDKEEPMTF